jgi:hypothetical protein
MYVIYNNFNKYTVFPIYDSCLRLFAVTMASAPAFFNGAASSTKQPSSLPMQDVTKLKRGATISSTSSTSPPAYGTSAPAASSGYDGSTFNTLRDIFFPNAKGEMIVSVFFAVYLITLGAEYMTKTNDDINHMWVAMPLYAIFLVVVVNMAMQHYYLNYHLGFKELFDVFKTQSHGFSVAQIIGNSNQMRKIAHTIFGSTYASILLLWLSGFYNDEINVGVFIVVLGVYWLIGFALADFIMDNRSLSISF